MMEKVLNPMQGRGGATKKYSLGEQIEAQEELEIWSLRCTSIDRDNTCILIAHSGPSRASA